jgi:hypothetical protein
MLTPLVIMLLRAVVVIFADAAAKCRGVLPKQSLLAINDEKT